MVESCSVVLVFVNYRDYSRLERLLELQELTPEAYRVVVVDNTEENSRSVDALDRIQKVEGLSLLTAENLGYLGAVRLALERIPSIRDADFLLVCNTDLMFDFSEFAKHLCAARDELVSRGIGVIAPRLVKLTGAPTRQLHLIRAPSARHMHRLARLFSNRIALTLYKRAGDLKRRLLSSRQRAAASLTDAQMIFAPHGSLMIFTSDYLRTDAPFDFPCFLFGEEIFVGLHAERNGLSCVFDETLTYSHDAHGSMGSWPSRAVSRYLRDAHRWAAGALTAYEADALT